MGPTSEPSPAIEVRGLSHEFTTRSGALRVLDAIDLDVAGNDYVALLGQSGAGKTTLLSILGGLEPPQAGAVFVDGHDLGALDGDGLADFRRHTVGFVFQHFGLLDALTASENVELALILDRTYRRERRRRAAQLLDAVGLSPRADHRPAELSGGERQRVAIARALANRPRLLLADEPTGNLDEAGARVVIDALEDRRQEDGFALVVVTHNPVLAGRAQRRITLAGGQVHEAVPA